MNGSRSRSQEGQIDGLHWAPLREGVRTVLRTSPQLFLGCPGGSDSKESACNADRPSFNPWVRKIPLEEDMATQSSILAWRIPRTEEPGGLQSMGFQRVGHD